MDWQQFHHLRNLEYLDYRTPETFIEAVLMDERNNPIINDEIHRQQHKFIWDNLQEGNNHLVILAPYKHGKTPQIGVGLPLYFMCQNPNVRIVEVCNVDDSAIDRVEEVREIIINNEQLHLLHPEIKPERDARPAKSKFKVKRTSTGKDYTLQAYGVLGSGTGSTIDVLIFDDICDENNTYSEALRSKVKRRVNHTWLNRLVAGGIFISIATAYHLEDAVHMLARNSEYMVLVQRISEDYSCIEQITFRGEPFQKIGELFDRHEVERLPLWTAKWDKESLIKRRNQTGVIAFERGFRQNAFSADASTFSHYKDIVIPDKLPVLNHHDYKFFCGVDLSGDKRPGNVVVSGGIDAAGHGHIWDIQRFKGSAPAFCDLLIALNERFRYSIMMIENNALQGQLIKMFNDKGARLPLSPYFTGSQKMKEGQGLPGLDVQFEQKLWSFYDGETEGHDPVCECGFCRFKKEFSLHPQIDQDDVIMSMWFLSEAVRMYYGVDEGFLIEDPGEGGFFT